MACHQETLVKFCKIISSCALLFFSTTCIGSEAINRLNKFLTEIDSFQANFSQTVWDENNKLVQESKGTIALNRPGEFRWQYEQPHGQLILADGEFLWVYDPELAQAYTRPITQALGSVPIMLLTNPRELHEDFRILVMSDKQEFSWLELIPLIQDTEFNRVRIGLDELGIRRMELYDNFSQKTAIEFTHMIVNVRFPEGYFDFEAPSGVDVVGYSE